MGNRGSLAQTQALESIDTTCINVRTDRGIEFYTYLLGFMMPLHKMRPVDVTVMANILLRREELMRSGVGREFIDPLLFSTEERKLLCQRIGCSSQALRQSLTRLRKCNAVIGNTVQLKLIPHFRLDNGEYMLKIHFFFNESDRP